MLEVYVSMAIPRITIAARALAPVPTLGSPSVLILSVLPLHPSPLVVEVMHAITPKVPPMDAPVPSPPTVMLPLRTIVGGLWHAPILARVRPMAGFVMMELAAKEPWLR